MDTINKEVCCEDQRGSLWWTYRLGLEGVYKKAPFQRHISKHDLDYPKQRVTPWVSMRTNACESCGKKRERCLFPFVYFIPHTLYTHLWCAHKILETLVDTANV